MTFILLSSYGIISRRGEGRSGLLVALRGGWGGLQVRHARQWREPIASPKDGEEFAAFVLKHKAVLDTVGPRGELLFDGQDTEQVHKHKHAYRY